MVRVIEEIIGACLLGESFDRFWLAVGPGRTGKGSLAELRERYRIIVELETGSRGG